MRQTEGLGYLFRSTECPEQVLSYLSAEIGDTETSYLVDTILDTNGHTPNTRPGSPRPQKSGEMSSCLVPLLITHSVSHRGCFVHGPCSMVVILLGVPTILANTIRRSK